MTTDAIYKERGSRWGSGDETLYGTIPLKTMCKIFHQTLSSQKGLGSRLSLVMSKNLILSPLATSLLCSLIAIQSNVTVSLQHDKRQLTF